jgi:hypothetical protein
LGLVIGSSRWVSLISGQQFSCVCWHHCCFYFSCTSYLSGAELRITLISFIISTIICGISFLLVCVLQDTVWSMFFLPIVAGSGGVAISNGIKLFKLDRKNKIL